MNAHLIKFFGKWLQAILIVLAIGVGSAPLVAVAVPTYPATYPVIFIHGLNSSGAVWNDLRDQLVNDRQWVFGGNLAVISGSVYRSDSPLSISTTIPPGDFYTLDFSSSTGLTLEQQGWELAKIIAAVKAANNVIKVVLVGHSMGGLAARAYLQGFATEHSGMRLAYGLDVARLVTVGTPHSGSSWPAICQRIQPLPFICTVFATDPKATAMEMLKKLVSPGLYGDTGLNTNTTDPVHGLPPLNYTSIVVNTNFTPGEGGGDGIVTVASQNLASLALPLNITNSGLHKQIPLLLVPAPWLCPKIGVASHTCETSLPEVQDNVVAELLGIPLTFRPHVKTNLPLALTSSGALLNSNVDPFGASTSAWFEWGTSRSQFDVVIGPTQLIETAHQSVAAGSNWLNISQNITGLAGNTPYYYRAVAQHIGAGTPIIKGAVLQFTTPPAGSTVLPAPTLTAPAQYANDQLTAPSFSWAAVPNASTYRIMVTSDPSALPTDPESKVCLGCLVNMPSPSLSYMPPVGYLNPGTTYYWQVHAGSSTSFGYWSAPQQFTTAPLATAALPAPVLTYPANGATTLSTTPGLSWGAVAGATSYRIMVANNAADLPPESWSLTCPLCVVNDTAYSTNYSPAVGKLTPGATYYWQVKARSPTNFGAWSLVGNFASGNPATGVIVTPRIAAGEYYSIALKPDGTVWAWGRNINGQLGDGTTIHRNLPVQVIGLSGVVAISAGSYHAVAVKSDGTVWTWGTNSVMNGPTTQSNSPVQVPVLSGVVSVAAAGGAMGFSYTIALKSDGTVWGWGDNWSGQLGDGTSMIPRVTPVQVMVSPGIPMGGVVAIAAGSAGHSMALKSDGTVWAWGNNGFGQLGDGTSNTTRLPPAQVMVATGIPMVGVLAIVAGQTHSMALRSDGTVWAWGYNAWGQLGDGTTVQRNMPVQVSSLSGVVSIAAGMGSGHSLAVKSNGTVWAWGTNSWGELGDGTTTQRNAPMQVSGLSGVVSVTGGGGSSLALKADNAMVAWGYNGDGQLGDGTTVNKLVPTLISGFATQLSDTIPPLDGTLSATPGNSQVSLSWNGFSDQGSGIASYKLVSSPVSSPTSCAASVPIYVGAATSFTDAAAVNAIPSYYRVCAVDHAGNVSAGAVASATPQPVITPTTGSIRVSIVPQAAANLGGQWRIVGEVAWRNSGSVATGLPYNTYSVEFSPVAGWATPAVQSVPISLVNPDIWVDSGGYIPPVAVNAPSSLQAVVTPAGGVSLSWLDNSSNEAVFTLEQKVGGTGAYSVVANLSPNTTSFLYAPTYGFAPGQQHCYRMRAYDGLLTYSGYSNEVCVTPSQVPVDPICAASSPLVGSTAKIAAGSNHTLSLRTDGTVWAWGSNLYGQLGDGTTTSSTVPVKVQGLSGVTAIAAGLNQSIALKSDGTVWLWGIYTPVLQTNGMPTGTSVPIRLNGLGGVVAIASGGQHGLALKADGTVWAWGYNANGQLGNGTNVDSAVPVQVTGLTGVTTIAAGYLHSLAMKADGSIWVWGPNGDGALGNGSIAIRQMTPSQVVGLSGVTAIAAGYQYTVALKPDGTVWAWGQNIYGQMGTGTATPSVTRTIPAQVVGVSGIVALAAGDGHVLAVKTDGSVIGWGYNLTGQLGDGTTLTPRPVVAASGLSSVIQVAAAANQSIALKSSGHVCSWGSNASGQLGSGGMADRAYPAVVSEVGGAGYLDLLTAPPPPPAPVISISATPFSFVDQNVGTISASQSAILSNTSNVALNIASIMASGDFGQSNNCGTTLAAGANCTISATFTPTAIGIRNGAITITSDAASSPNTISLSGTGKASVRRDFNGDGKSDILWRGPAGEVAVWLMNGSALQSSGVAGIIPANWQLAGTGDFNGDGRADIVRRGPNGEVAIWIMNGSVIQSSGSVTTVPLGWNIASTDDFNGDGKADLLWRGPAGEVAVWLMNGSTIQSSSIVSTLPAAWVIAESGDFNGDGKADILWHNTVSGENSVWLMNGAALLSSAYLNTLNSPWLIAGTGDFNGDGKTDILWRNTTTGENAVWVMNGASISSSGYLNTLAVIWSVSAVGDYNGDGKADILWRNAATGENAIWLINGLSVSSSAYLNVVPASWAVAAQSQTAAAPVASLSTASLSFAAQHTGTTSAAQLVTLSNTGSAVLNIASITASAEYASTTTCGATLAVGANCTFSVSFTPLASGLRNGAVTVTSDASAASVILSGTGKASVSSDFNGDSNSDILLRNAVTGQNVIWLMNGTTMSSSGYLNSVAAPWNIAANGDFDGDGKADILWRDPVSGNDAIWFMNGTAQTSGGYTLTVAAPWNIIGAADFDGDGKADLLWRDATSGANAVWLMNGLTQRSGASLSGIVAPWALAALADFNGDGKADILWRNGSTGQNALWLMNGTAMLSSTAVSTLAAPWSIAGTGDFDGDGKADILWRNTVTGQNAVWYMNGAVQTSGAYLNSVPVNWNVEKVADYNGDGKADLLWRDSVSGMTAVWLMNGAVLSTSGVINSSLPAAWGVAK